MTYARLNLDQTNYTQIDNWKYIDGNAHSEQLQKIYYDYCRHRRFSSVMPIFESEFIDPRNDVIGYYDGQDLVAFSLMRRYDSENVEAIQFAWTYHKPKLKLGISSLKNECAIYKERGFKFLYLGGADEYKKQFDGFEILGPV